MNIFETAKDEKGCPDIQKHTEETETLNEDGYTTVMMAAKSGQVETIRSFIGIGANLDFLGKNSQSALLLASNAGHTEVERLLLAAGASVSTRNATGETPLHQATLHGNEEIANMLLDHGADIDAQDKNGFSPLYLAADGNILSMVKLLLKRGADVNLTDTGGLSPLNQAAYREYHEVVLLLLEYRADPNLITAKAGNSALVWASQKGPYIAAKALLDAGANIYHTTVNGNTPLRIAKDEMMKRLIRSYQSGGPSWLVQQLCARGVEWPVVCDIEDRLLKEGFVSKEIFLAAPMSLFTHEYLRSLGIPHFGTRVAVINVRLEGTWLGARLAALGVTPFWIRSCETCVFEALGCGTEAAFANLPAATLSAEALKEVGVPVQYHLVLRALHEQLGKAREEKEKEKGKEEKKHSGAATVTSGAANAAF